MIETREAFWEDAINKTSMKNHILCRRFYIIL